MKVTREITSFDEFDAWSGGRDTLQRLRKIGCDDAVFGLVDELFEGEVSETDINDFLWFEDETITEYLGFDFWKYSSKEEASAEDDDDDDDDDNA